MPYPPGTIHGILYGIFPRKNQVLVCVFYHYLAILGHLDHISGPKKAVWLFHYPRRPPPPTNPIHHAVKTSKNLICSMDNLLYSLVFCILIWIEEINVGLSCNKKVKTGFDANLSHLHCFDENLPSYHFLAPVHPSSRSLSIMAYFPFFLAHLSHIP